MFRVQWPEQVIQTQALKEVEREVKRCAHSPGSTVAVIGPCGIGKTVAVFQVLRSLGPGHKFVVIQQPEKELLRISSIMAAMIRGLVPGAEEPRRDIEARTEQFRRVLGEATSRHKVVLVIDEAHALSRQTLRGLKRLLELSFGMRVGGLFSVVLICQPEMWTRLRDVREMNLRTRKVDMKPMSQREAAELVRLVAEHESLKMEDQAIEELARRMVMPLDLCQVVTELKTWTEELGEDKVTWGMVTTFVGDSLKQTMERYGITETELAKKAGLSAAVVSQTLKGKYPGRDKSRELEAAMRTIAAEKEPVHAGT